MNAPKTRKRPVKDQGEAALKMSILDEMENAAQERISAGQRIALAPKLKLDWSNQEPGFNYQWATDSESYPITLQQMLDSGYTFVRHKNGSLSGQHVIQHSKGCNLYLMRCKEEFYKADQKAKHDKAVAQHQQISQVGSREYAGESKELGKGKVADLSFQESPDAISLMEGE